MSTTGLERKVTKKEATHTLSEPVVVVAVEWLNYSKKIIIVSGADLGEFLFVDVRR